MKILFLGDVVGIAGCSKLTNNLLSEIKSKNIDFVIVNGENAASQGVGLTKEICKDFFNCGVNVITTGNHVWDQKEIMEYIDKELNRLGYGGGFYDRYIEKISKIKKIVKVGLAFSFQKFKTIPTNKYDKKLDLIITEKDII